MASPFRLYREMHPWCTEQDYATILETVRGRQAKRILEFGPGNSTLALIEGGATSIDACESSFDWLEVWNARLRRKFPDVVRLHYYQAQDLIAIRALDGYTYDLGLVDGPTRVSERPAVIRYALERCSAVLVPTEDWDPTPETFHLRPILQQLSEATRRPIQFMETGPAAGGYALLTEAPC